MKSSLETMIDMAVLMLILAAGIPTILFALGVFSGEGDYGFGTLEEKSVIATTAQINHLGFADQLDEKAMWTDTHFMMLRVVDGGDAASRTISANGVEETYIPDEVYQMDRAAAVREAYGFARNNGFIEWEDEVYHLYVDEDGSVRFNTAREPIE